MSVKAVLIVCAQALLIQLALSQCSSSGNYGAGLAGYGWGTQTLAGLKAGSGLACGAELGSAALGLDYGLGHGADLGTVGYGASLGYGSMAIEAIPTSGGGFSIYSVSAIAPTGLSIASENVFEGTLSVIGELPFLSALAVEGVLPSAGTGTVSYSCGNGVTAIENIAPAAATYGSAAAGIAPGIAAIAPAVGAITPALAYGGLVGHECGCGHY